MNEITEKQAYEYALDFLPYKIETESKENGENSGVLEVYRHDNKWFIRYLDGHVVFAHSILTAINKMIKWLDERGIIYDK